MIPYGRQLIDEDDIQAVVDVLRSDWLTTGPRVAEFEGTLAALVGAGHGVAVSSGTAALHAAMFALDIGSGDEVILSPMTFAATANCVLYQGGTPVFSDVDLETLLIDPDLLEDKITSRTKAVIAVDYTGHPCDYDRLRAITDRHGLALVADGCHALGAEYKGRRVGTLADLTVFSFHPVKHIATGEGGMVVTDDPGLAGRMRLFRNHGISTDFRDREEEISWHYEMVELGYNYRLTDLQCALGLSQLAKLDTFLSKRREIARTYDAYFSKSQNIQPLRVSAAVRHAYHLYVVRVAREKRARIFMDLRQAGIGVNVHYIPVHLHPYYRGKGYGSGLCPRAEAVYETLLSLPMHPGLTDRDINTITAALGHAAGRPAREDYG